MDSNITSINACQNRYWNGFFSVFPPYSIVCANLTDSRTFIDDLSKIVGFLDWCKDSQISLH